jgi:hypothetical protein
VSEFNHNEKCKNNLQGILFAPTDAAFELLDAEGKKAKMLYHGMLV